MASLSRKSPGTSWRRLGSLRLRSALASLLIVGVVFCLSAFGVIAMLRSSLYTSAGDTAQAAAFDIASFITSHGRLPAHLPLSGDELAGQVIGPTGAVLLSSRTIAGQPPMTDLRPLPGEEATRAGVVLHIRRFSPVGLDLDYRFVVAAAGFKVPGHSGTVLVAYSLGVADHTVGVVTLALGIALPLLALLVAALVWLFTGWSLRPVEDIRSRVAELSAGDLHSRVPEPPVQDEVGRLARTMNAMLGRLEISNNQQRQLIADVAHELRNPLAALRAQLEVAVVHPGEGARGLLEGSVVEVDRMSRLVEDLLTLARIDEGALPLHLDDVDLDDLALFHADRLRTRAMVEISVAGVEAARVVGDEAQLTRVAANLADNAERYALGQVRFAVFERDSYCYMTVTDDGPGVPRDERERIFERFVRLDSARTPQASGAGLGLAIVREIVHAHGGRVWVEGASPGARFVVQLAAPSRARESEDALDWLGSHSDVTI